MQKFYETIMLVSTGLNNIVWGPVMFMLLIGTGIFLSIKTKFLQFRKFGYVIKNTVFSMFSKKQHTNDNSGVTPFQAVSTALAATLGTGSITGLATAITLGGPGVVFWMWVSAAVGMITKYSEIILSIKFREKSKEGTWVGGPMYYIKKGLGFKNLSVLFAFFAIFACLGIGNATQSNSISVALNNTLGVSNLMTAIVLTVISAVVIIGGIKRIALVNEKFVPFMAVFYITCALIVLFINFQKIPNALLLIFKEAFNFKAAAGGVGGYGIVTAMQYGLSRGVFSNEAGLGSAPIAHAASDTKEPVRQGLWGMFEVFFSTIVICTLSALVVLTSGLWVTGEYTGAALTIASFDSVIPYAGGICVTFSTIFFALSTILGWAYYGEVCVEYLFGKSKAGVLCFRCVYIIVVFLGAIGNLDLIWSISEAMNGLMAIPNLIGIIGLNKVVIKTTNEYFSRKKIIK